MESDRDKSKSDQNSPTSQNSSDGWDQYVEAAKKVLNQTSRRWLSEQKQKGEVTVSVS